MNTQPFNPTPDATANINVAGTTANVAVFATGGYRQVRVMNDGTATVWIKFGSSTVTADTANDIPIPSGAVEVFTVPAESGGTYAAAIAAGSTGKIYFTPGSGI